MTLNLQWKKITWYSRLATLIVFLGLVPILCFYVGMQFQVTAETILHERTNEDIFLKNQ